MNEKKIIKLKANTNLSSYVVKVNRWESCSQLFTQQCFVVVMHKTCEVGSQWGHCVGQANTQ
jgi:hypothetical protein